MVEDMVLDMSNDIKFGKVNVDDDVVGAVILICLQKYSCNVLRSINFALNNTDAEKMGNINEFIDKIEALYYKAEAKRDEVMAKRF